jgi:hypothetical protein
MWKFTETEKLLYDWSINNRDLKWHLVFADMEIQKSNFQEAEKIYKYLLKEHPKSKIINFNLGLTLLSQRKCEEGWPYYEWRNNNPRQDMKGIPLKLPSLHTLKDKNVLVKAEMGIGDQIMMGRYLSDLSSIVLKLTVCIPNKLRNIYERSLPKNIKFVTRDLNFREGEFDEIIGIGSLAGIFWKELGINLKNSNFIRPDPKKVYECSKYINHLPGKKKIGFGWRGGVSGADHQERSLKEKDIEFLTSWKNTSWIDIQYLTSEDDYPEYLNENKNIYRINNSGWDLDESIALIKSLDYVITPRQTIAHLIGSIAEKGSVLVPKRQEWRYWEKENVWEWYQNVDYKKQKERDSWINELEKIRSEFS